MEDRYDNIQQYESTVVYTVPDSYTLYIPAEIYAGQENSIGFEELNVALGKSVDVTITNLSNDDTVELTNVFDDTQKIYVGFTDSNERPITHDSQFVGCFVPDLENTPTNITFETSVHSFD